MKAQTLQVCCTNIAVPDGVSDCCSMHSFNTTELIKLRNVYYLSNFSPSQFNLRDQKIQTNLFLYSNIHVHTMNMHLLSLYSILGHIFHHRTHLLSFSCLFFPLLPLFFFLFFFSPSLCLFHIDNISLLHNQLNNIDFLLTVF